MTCIRLQIATPSEWSRDDNKKYMSPDEIREDIELKIVELIKQLLEDGTITEARAQQLSTIALQTLTPGMSLEELYRAIPALDNHATELAPIVIPYMREYEENITRRAQTSVEELIKQGQYDAAIKLAKQATTREVDLVWQGSGKKDE